MNRDCHGGGETSEADKCPMIMMFHAGHCERILWNGWVASTVTSFTLSALAIFLISFVYEALKFLREQLLRKEARKEAQRLALDLQPKITPEPCGSAGCSNAPLAEPHNKTYWQRIFSSAHLIQTALNLVQLTVGYILMLIFMLFNYWLCLAVVLGLGLGYFFFGWVKKEVPEDCC